MIFFIRSCGVTRNLWPILGLGSTLAEARGWAKKSEPGPKTLSGVKKPHEFLEVCPGVKQAHFCPLMPPKFPRVLPDLNFILRCDILRVSDKKQAFPDLTYLPRVQPAGSINTLQISPGDHKNFRFS